MFERYIFKQSDARVPEDAEYDASVTPWISSPRANFTFDPSLQMDESMDDTQMQSEESIGATEINSQTIVHGSESPSQSQPTNAVGGQTEENTIDQNMEVNVHQTEKQIEEEKKEAITLLRSVFRTLKAIMAKMEGQRSDLGPYTLSQIALAVKSTEEDRENIFTKNQIAYELFERLLVCYRYSDDEKTLFMKNPILNQIFRDNVDQIKGAYRVQNNRRLVPLKPDQEKRKILEYKKFVDQLLVLANKYCS